MKPQNIRGLGDSPPSNKATRNLLILTGHRSNDIIDLQTGCPAKEEVNAIHVFWIGICFEIPLIMFFLTKIGVVRPEWLSKYRRFAYIAAFILGAIITPTFDPVNQCLVAVPIVFLYEFGILLSKLAGRKKAEPASTGS